VVDLHRHGLLGIGIALGFASMANSSLRRCPQNRRAWPRDEHQHPQHRCALGSGIATSLVVSGLMPGGLPKEHGYVLAFAVSGLALVVAALAALTIPKRTGLPLWNVSRTPRSRRGRGRGGCHRLRPEDLA